MDGEDFSGEDIKGAAEQFGALLDQGFSSYREADELDEIIEYYIAEGQLNRASGAVELGLEWHPNSSMLLQRKAYVLHITGHTAEGLEYLKRAELFDPHEGELYSLMGEMLSHLERFEEAVESFERALDYSDEKPEIFVSLAYTYLSWGKTDQVVEQLKRILDYDVENEQILFEVAYCFDLIDNQAEAINFFTGFTDKYPYSFLAWINLGNCYQQNNEFEQAIWAYDFAIAIMEEYGTAHMQKGLCLYELGRFAEAIESFNLTMEYDGPDGLVYCNIANCYEELGEIKKARGFYKMAIRSDASLSDAWFGMGLTYKIENNFTQALHYIKRALKIDPEESDYLIELGEVYLSMEDFEQAEITFEKICRNEPWMAEAWLDWAMCLFENGKTDLSVKVLLDALDLYPADHRFYYRLAAYYFTMGLSVKAFESLNTALEINWEDHFLLFVHAPFLQDSESVAETIDLYRN